MAYVLTIHCCRCEAAIEVPSFPRRDDPLLRWVEVKIPSGRFMVDRRRDHLCPAHAEELLPAEALAKLRDPRKRAQPLPEALGETEGGRIDPIDDPYYPLGD